MFLQEVLAMQDQYMHVDCACRARKIVINMETESSRKYLIGRRHNHTGDQQLATNI
jgi:predicted RNA-binding protein Jag